RGPGVTEPQILKEVICQARNKLIEVINNMIVILLLAQALAEEALMWDNQMFARQQHRWHGSSITPHIYNFKCFYITGTRRFANDDPMTEIQQFSLNVLSSMNLE
ncbi:hypothetical protein ACJX0J_012489, partial [Zea mays]